MSHPRPRVALTAAVLAAAVVSGVVVGPSAQAVVGDPAQDADFAFTARLSIGGGERACSGALVDPQWVLTAASCFAADPLAGFDVPAGAPEMAVTATIGRTDLGTPGGEVRDVVELRPRSDRDLVLARLSKPVAGISPVAVGSSAPVAAERLTVAGYGRTKTEWAPMKLHSGKFTVDAAAQATTVGITGSNGNAVCAGDTGGPVLRAKSGGGFELVAVANRSYQGGCFGSDAAETRTNASAVRADDIRDWVTTTVTGAPITDFNGDGVEDIAIADPAATVGGDANAGVVRLVYGGGKGIDEISQDLGWVPGGSEAGDWFGDAIDTVDYNQDGYTDLVVGTTLEDLGGEADAGMADILYGGKDGLGTGTTKVTHLEQGQGAGAIKASGSEAGDRMGDAIAAGTTAAGEPYVLIGVPGEAIGSEAKAGGAFYLRGDVNVAVHQDKADVPGAVEAGDGFGAAVAADANHIAIGAPNENISGDNAAGNLAVFSHTLHADGHPKPLFGLDQDNPAIGGGAEAGDEFGYALAIAPFHASGTAAADESILAIGAPGEGVVIDGAERGDAGRVIQIRIKPDGTWSYLRELKQGTGDDDVSGTSEAGDRMGESLTAINTKPHSVSTVASMRLAVGAPGEDLGTATNAGAVHTFSLAGSAGPNDRWIEAGDGDGIPGSPGTNQYLGRNIHYTTTQLYVGMPYGPGLGALYALPMSNTIVNGTVAPVTAHKPGADGLPNTGIRFGAQAR